IYHRRILSLWHSGQCHTDGRGGPVRRSGLADLRDAYHCDNALAIDDF
ncbi:MAG: hypothetical protein IMF11_19700, partial [Proteobacteria bacterium]|nr:hypothetical protein [Pseudomonadota bacterium]